VCKKSSLFFTLQKPFFFGRYTVLLAVGSNFNLSTANFLCNIFVTFAIKTAVQKTSLFLLQVMIIYIVSKIF